MNITYSNIQDNSTVDAAINNAVLTARLSYNEEVYWTCNGNSADSLLAMLSDEDRAQLNEGAKTRLLEAKKIADAQKEAERLKRLTAEHQAWVEVCDQARALLADATTSDFTLEPAALVPTSSYNQERFTVTTEFGTLDVIKTSQGRRSYNRKTVYEITKGSRFQVIGRPQKLTTLAVKLDELMTELKADFERAAAAKIKANNFEQALTDLVGQYRKDREWTRNGHTDVFVVERDAGKVSFTADFFDGVVRANIITTKKVAAPVDLPAGLPVTCTLKFGRLEGAQLTSAVDYLLA
jgi:hypothetical protein